MTIFVLALAVYPVYAGNTVEEIEYGDTVEVEFSSRSDEAFFEFEGEEGDVIYIEAVIDFSSDLSYDEELEMELRDSSDDLVARSQNLLFLSVSPFILLELEESDTYTIVLEFSGSSEPTALLKLEETVYLSDDSVEFTVEDDGFATLVGIRVEDDGLYQINVSRGRGDLPVGFDVRDFSDEFGISLATVSGEALQSWSVVLELERDIEYTGVVGPSLFLLGAVGLYGGGSIDVTLSMEPFDD